MMEKNHVKLLCLLIATLAVAQIVLSQVNDDTGEPEVIRIGVLSPTKTSFESYHFLADIAFDEVNEFCLNNSIRFRFEPVYNYTNKGAGDAIKITDWYHSQNITILLGYDWGSFLDACDYQSRNYGMVIVAPYGNSPVHRDIYPHIFQLTPISALEAKPIARAAIDLGFNETKIIRERDRGMGYSFQTDFMIYYSKYGGIMKDPELIPSSIYYIRVNHSLARLADNLTDYSAVLYPDSIEETLFDNIHNHPRLLNSTWFGSSYVGYNHSEILSMVSVLPDIKLIHPDMVYRTPIPCKAYDNINELYLEKFGRNMTRYGGNMFDAVWLTALTVIETNGYNNDTFVRAFPEIAERYNGTSGNYVLDEYGDRLHADYNLFMYKEKDGEILQIKIGYYSSEKDELVWTRKP